MICFCTRFLATKNLHQHFLRLKFLHIYFSVCCFFAIKNKCTNICDTNNCNAKNFGAKNDVAKINPQKYLWIYFCNNNFCVKNFCAKNFCVTVFRLFIFATVYSAAYILHIWLKWLFNQICKKRCAIYGVINVQKFLHIYFCTCFFVYLFLYI